MITSQAVGFLDSSQALRSIARSWDLSWAEWDKELLKGRESDKPSRQSHAYLQQPRNQLRSPAASSSWVGTGRHWPSAALQGILQPLAVLPQAGLVQGSAATRLGWRGP